jgi:hypothetical protein
VGQLARLAHYLWKMGDEAGAKKSYAEAVEELIPEQMRSDGDRYERMARTLNPRIEAFHIHC